MFRCLCTRLMATTAPGGAPLPGPSRPFVLGITGGIAMGKSTVTAQLRAIGVPVHDSDAAVHRLYALGGAAVAPIADAFGPRVVQDDGAVSRPALSAALRADPSLFATLDGLVHPLVRADREAFVASHSSSGDEGARGSHWLVGADVPLLFETMPTAAARRVEGIDRVLVASCPPAVQRHRALQRPNLTPAKLDDILARQASDSDRRAGADFVVDTDAGAGEEPRSRASAKCRVAECIEALARGPAAEGYAAWARASPSTPPRAVSLDLDDTLWPTLPPLKDAKLELVAAMRERLPRSHGGNDATCESRLGVSMRRSCKDPAHTSLLHDLTELRRIALANLAEEFGDADADENVAAVLERFTEARGERTDAYLLPAALPAVAALRERGLAVGALTNGNARRCGRLGAAVDFWVGAGDCGAAKPALAPFLAACAAAGNIRPGELVHVGDSVESDVAGALAAGCRAVWCPQLVREGYDGARKLREEEERWEAVIKGSESKARRIECLEELPAVLSEWCR